ncbi:MAG: hypothetical protein KZQ59_09265 [Candidatus Thiodiazotropha sp. (ex Lucinoma aequizonata)]|nr:hypothetical protein [Candidatus Thiodiazotropha sp. (ex Lucinoma aequizonata)]MCU7897258.1 hypothetical protein [Candidatus Thiodiazotropha sp. (ex Lucinoma aequizonata)]
MTAYCASTVLRTSRFRIALPQQAARALLHYDYRNDSTASAFHGGQRLKLSTLGSTVITPNSNLTGA